MLFICVCFLLPVSHRCRARTHRVVDVLLLGKRFADQKKKLSPCARKTSGNVRDDETRVEHQRVTRVVKRSHASIVVFVSLGPVSTNSRTIVITMRRSCTVVDDLFFIETVFLFAAQREKYIDQVRVT
uniref:Secreted protein n=1 Tax=Sipha flava TaxID=143950 RepID=A0A2S2Q2A1_9HEMI